MQDLSLEKKESKETNSDKERKIKEKPNLKKFTGSAISEAVNELPPKTKGNIIVGTAGAVGMFGRTFYNNTKAFSKNREDSPLIQVHPYPWAALGAIIVPVCKDEHDQLHIVVVHNIRKDLQIKYRLSEGLMHPKSCADATEMLPNNTTKSLANGYAPNDNAEQRIAFKGYDAKSAYKGEGYQAVKAVPPDKNLIETAIREGYEEIGLEIKPDQLTTVYAYDDAGRIHIYANVYLVDLTKTHNELPKLNTNDTNEIAEIKWIKPQQITYTINKANIKFEIDGIEIPEKYAVCIGFALKEFRQQEIKKLNKRFATADVLVSLIADVYEGDEKELQLLLGDTPLEEFFSKKISMDLISGIGIKQKQERATALAELGHKAEIYHQKLVQLGKALAAKSEGKKLSQVKPFTKENILEVVNTTNSKAECVSFATNSKIQARRV